jgi:hypothetical protein
MKAKIVNRESNFEIMNIIKKEFDEFFMKQYVYDNFLNYCDEEEMEEAGYDDYYSYYTEEGAGGNGLEYDILELMWKYIKEKFNIDLSEDSKENEDLRYDLDYYIKSFFPYYEVKDYRKENDIDKIIKNLNNW